MKQIKVNLLIAALLMTVGINAQDLVVTLTNSNTEIFAVEDIRSIKFGTETMILNETDGTVNTWNIDDIEKYAFDLTTQVEENSTVFHSDLNIYPNPAADHVNIRYTSNLPGKINIIVFDMNGRMLETVYEGEHRDMTDISWNPNRNHNLPAGMYLVKITTDNKIITKPLIIK